MKRIFLSSVPRLHFRLALTLLLGIWSFSTGTAHAQIAYSYVTDSSSYTIGPSNPSVPVNVYLQESLTKASSLIALDGGLFSAGVSLTASGSTATITGAMLNTSGFSISAGAAIASGSSGYIQDQATGAAFAGGSTNPTTTTNLYFLGTFTLTGTGTLGSTTFTLGAISSNAGYGGNTTTIGTLNGYYDLDLTNGLPNPPGSTYYGQYTNTAYSGAADNPTTFTVNAIPEPGSMALCGFAACAMGLAAWRRRKGQTTQVAQLPSEVFAKKSE